MVEYDFEKLVALNVKALALFDRASVEISIGENALSDGYALKAEQHFGSRHYRQRAEAAEAQTDELFTVLAIRIGENTSRPALAASTPAALSAAAVSLARERRYGSARVEGQPQFA